MPLTYRLERAARAAAGAPELDDAQRAVVEHDGGPLLVLAGPGTGKTTTLVEAVVDRIDRRGADPASVLALTFSRRAAEQLRDRVAARLQRTVSAPLASTFHSFAYGLVRAYQPAGLYEQPLRLLTAPEQDVVMRQLLTRRGRVRPVARDAFAGARDSWVHRRGPRSSGTRPREGPRPARPRVARGRRGPARVAGGRAVPRAVPHRPRQCERARLPRAHLPRRAPCRALRRQGRPAAALLAGVRRRVPRHRPEPGPPAQGDCRRRPRPGRGGRPRPVDLRLPRRRGARHSRVPARVPPALGRAGSHRRSRHDASVRV